MKLFWIYYLKKRKKMILLSIFIAIASAKIYAIKLEKSADPIEYALRFGLEHVEHVHDWDIFRVHRRVPEREHSIFLRDSNVLEFHEQQKRKQQTRNEDPLYKYQWHLHGSDYSVNSGETSLLGTGVNIAIVDDGLQHSHPDLISNYNSELSYDFNDNDSDPAPNTYTNDGHGTSAAGVCCAAQKNSHCGRGVAPGASVSGIRLVAKGTYDYEEANGLSHRYNDIDIYSCSWGPEDSGTHLEGPGPITNEVLYKNYKRGRHGKGSIYVWAGGNGRDNKDNGNYDGYANHPATIAIGALDYGGKQSWYSEDCACLTAVAPSSGALYKGITTVDLTGYSGYSRGECTKTFGGTSSAAPLAAGIIALLLESNPALTNRDVQHIIAKGATRIDVENSDWSTGTYKHSHHYGFGLLKIEPLLSAASEHQLVPPQRTLLSLPYRNPLPILSNTNIDVPVNGAMSFIEQIQVTISFTHSMRGNLEIVLENMSTGTRSILAETRNDRHFGLTKWTYSTVRHWGEEHTNNASWRIHLKDTSTSALGGVFHSASIKIFGY